MFYEAVGLMISADTGGWVGGRVLEWGAWLAAWPPGWRCWHPGESLLVVAVALEASLSSTASLPCLQPTALSVLSPHASFHPSRPHCCPPSCSHPHPLILTRPPAHPALPPTSPLHTEPKRRDEYLQRLMGPPNATWQQIIEQAKQNVEVLKQAEVIRNVQNILQVRWGRGRGL